MGGEWEKGEKRELREMGKSVQRQGKKASGHRKGKKWMDTIFQIYIYASA